MAAAGASENPQILVCDTDALIQIFVSGQGELLKKLKRRYGIQPVIPESVEGEITRRGQRKSSLFLPGAQKAMSNGALVVLEERTLGAFTSNDPHSTYTSIQLVGQENALHIGLGEAFVYAAGLVLKAPVLSNDAKAVLVADRVGIKRPQHIMRAYDLFLLFHQIGELEERDCDNIRQTLLSAGESLPFQVRNMSYSAGLSHVYPRLVDGTSPALATGPQAELADLSQLVVSPTPTQTSSQSEAATATIGEIIEVKSSEPPK